MSGPARAVFNSEAVINWFPGHMAKATRIIGETLKKVDTVIEVRDARVRKPSEIPLSSTNPALSELLGPHKKHIVVFTKKDLASPTVNRRLLQVMKEKHGIRYAMMADLTHQWKRKEKAELFGLINKAAQDFREKLEIEDKIRAERLAEAEKAKAIEEAAESESQQAAQTRPLTAAEKLEAKKRQERLNYLENQRRINAKREIRGPTRTSISLIMGLPNVGKSTLINQIIGRRRAGVAAEPGWTRGQQLYRIDGLLLDEAGKTGKKGDGKLNLITPALKKLHQRSAWLLDTPGVMLPHRMDTEQGLKLAICGLVADRVVPDSYITMSEYLFYLLTHESFKSPTPVRVEVDPDQVTLGGAASASAEAGPAAPERPTNPATTASTAATISNAGWWQLYGFEAQPRSFDALMDHIGRRYGAKNRFDQGKIFIHHFRDGKLGRFTLDFVN